MTHIPFVFKRINGYLMILPFSGPLDPRTTSVMSVMSCTWAVCLAEIAPLVGLIVGIVET